MWRAGNPPLFSRVQYDVLVRVWGHLMAAPDIATIEQAAEQLLDMLRAATDLYAAEQDIDHWRINGVWGGGAAVHTAPPAGNYLR